MFGVQSASHRDLDSLVSSWRYQSEQPSLAQPVYIAHLGISQVMIGGKTWDTPWTNDNQQDPTGRLRKATHLRWRASWNRSSRYGATMSPLALLHKRFPIVFVRCEAYWKGYELYQYMILSLYIIIYYLLINFLSHAQHDNMFKLTTCCMDKCYIPSFIRMHTSRCTCAGWKNQHPHGLTLQARNMFATSCFRTCIMELHWNWWHEKPLGRSTGNQFCSSNPWGCYGLLFKFCNEHWLFPLHLGRFPFETDHLQLAWGSTWFHGTQPSGATVMDSLTFKA